MTFRPHAKRQRQLLTLTHSSSSQPLPPPPQVLNLPKNVVDVILVSLLLIITLVLSVRDDHYGTHDTAWLIDCTTIVVQAYTATTVIGSCHNRQRKQCSCRHRQPIFLSLDDDQTSVTGSYTDDQTSSSTTTTAGIRLNKVFTKVYSRRATDALIADGRIKVNGTVVTDLGRRVVPYQDIVLLDDEIYLNWEQHVNIESTGSSNINADTQYQASPSTSSASSSSLLLTTSSSSTTTNQHENDNTSDNDQHVYIKYWKPVGVISTTDRSIPHNLIDSIYRGITAISKTTIRTLRHRRRPQNVLPNNRRIFNVGRLDKDSSGLLLLTSDGRVPNILLSKQFVHAKVYDVVIDRPITYEHLQLLRQGIVITTDTIRQRKHVSFSARTLPCTIVPLYNNQPPTKRNHDDNDDHDDDDSNYEQYVPTNELRITLIEGRNRQIRVMLQTIGSYQVLALHRMQFMSTIDLTNLQQPGEWAYLNATELSSVHRAIAIAPQQPQQIS